jgi:hypothetical protein
MTSDDSSSTGKAGVASDKDNFPGFEYLQRVISSMSRGMLAQTEELNEAWSKIRRDEGYDFKDVLKSWTRLVDNSFGVMMDVVQPLGPRPNWLVIPWSLNVPPSPETSVSVDGPAEPDGNLDFTEFFGAGKQPEKGKSLYERPPYRQGTRVQIRLNPSAFPVPAKDTAGDYISFVYRKSQGAAPPLVIVVLRIKNDIPAWDSQKAYFPEDRAMLDGVIYRCIKRHTNIRPPDTTHWAVWGSSVSSTMGAESQ